MVGGWEGLAVLSEPFSKVSSLGPLQNMPESDKEKEKETQKTRERETSQLPKLCYEMLNVRENWGGPARTWGAGVDGEPDNDAGLSVCLYI